MSKQAVDWAESLPTLPTGIKPLLVHLARFARKDDHTCYRAQDVIAVSIDQGIRTVERNVSWLREKGLISSKRHYKNGVRAADEITLNVGATLPVNLAGSRPSKCRVIKPTLPVNYDNLTRQLEGAYPSTTTNPSIYKLTNQQNRHCEDAIAIADLKKLNEILETENQSLKDQIEALKNQLAEQQKPQVVAVIEKPKATKTPAVKTEQQQANAETWQSYANAYFNRYQVEPLRNAKTNTVISNFVKAVGAEVAPAMARYYVNMNNPFYLQKVHSVGLLLSDAEQIRTQFLKNREITRQDIKRVEAAQISRNAIDELCAQNPNGEPW